MRMVSRPGGFGNNSTIHRRDDAEDFRAPLRFDGSAVTTLRDPRRTERETLHAMHAALDRGSDPEKVWAPRRSAPWGDVVQIRSVITVGDFAFAFDPQNGFSRYDT